MAQEASPKNEITESTPNGDKDINEIKENEPNNKNESSEEPNTNNTKKAIVNNDKNIHVPKDKKLKIDYVAVKNAFVSNDIVFYDIHVKTCQHYWHVTKRYSQFEDLHSALMTTTKQKLPLLPAKHYKWFTDHTKPSFIEKRRALLDNYVKKLRKCKGVNESQCVVNFFHNDKSDEKVIEQRKREQQRLSDLEQANEGNMEDEEEEDEYKKELKKEHRQSDDYDFPQDQEVTNIVIQSTRKMTDHVLYQICVSNSHKRSSSRAWTVLKRFTQFYEMDTKLRAALETDLLPKLPPPPSRKFKFVHDHMDDDFIEERMVLLENYLSKLLRFPEVVRNEDFLEFLGVDM